MLLNPVRAIYLQIYSEAKAKNVVLLKNSSVFEPYSSLFVEDSFCCVEKH